MNRALRLGRLETRTLFRTLCQRFKTNIEPFFDHWGVSLGDAERTFGRQYPMLAKELWRADPRQKQPMADVGECREKFRLRQDRTAWQAFATSETNYGSLNEDEAQPARNLFDGSLDTYWNSYLNNEYTEYQLPFYIIIDMRRATAMQGIYFANGGAKCVSHFRVQTLSRTDDINIDDSAEEQWREWGEVTRTIDDYVRIEQFVAMPTPRTARYLRLVFDRQNLYGRPDAEKDPAYAADWWAKGWDRAQRFAEFGVWQ